MTPTAESVNPPFDKGGEGGISEAKPIPPSVERGLNAVRYSSPGPEASQPLTVYPMPPPPSRTETRVNKIVTVESGDTIISLSQKYYQRADITLLDKILEINPEITNPHLILAEQKLKIPEINEASLVVPSPDGTYKVHLGTFSRPEYADSYKNEPILKGKSIEVIPRKLSPQETWYRVFAGNFQTRAEALKAVQTLKEKGLLQITGEKS